MNEPSQRSLVVGASGGLGRAICTRLARRGDDIGLLAREPTRLQSAFDLVRDEGAKARSLSADVLDFSEVVRAVQTFGEWAGGVDHLIFAAGRFKAIGPVSVCDPTDWRLDLETSTMGAFHSTRAALPYLRASRHPTISILVGPGHRKALPNGSAYSSAQAALVRLVETLSIELRPFTIPVYAVFPGIAPTPLIQHILESTEGRKWLPSFTESFAEGKEVEPEVVGEMIQWLTDRRPTELSGRVVFAPVPPDLLETRLEVIQKEDRHRLRLS